MQCACSLRPKNGVTFSLSDKWLKSQYLSIFVWFFWYSKISIRLKPPDTGSCGRSHHWSGSLRGWKNSRQATLQMKGQWESNINVWFQFMYSQKWNCYFQNRIVMFCLPVPKLIYLREIYIFQRLVCLFCCKEICGLILGIYKSLTYTWMWKLGLRLRNSRKGIHKWDFPCSAQCIYIRQADGIATIVLLVNDVKAVGNTSLPL